MERGRARKTFNMLPYKYTKFIGAENDFIQYCSVSKEVLFHVKMMIDLYEKTFAALMDAFSMAYRRNIDLGSDDIMFNSGVMLINLNKWRRDKLRKNYSFYSEERPHSAR